MHLREQQDACGGLLVGEAVVGRLGGAVCEVDALAEHVAGGGRLGRGDAQPLREDAAPVGEPAAVPQQLPVAHVLEGLGLALALHLEGLVQLEGVRAVRRGVSLLQVALEQRVQLAAPLDRRELRAELLVAQVDGVHIEARALARVDDARGHLDVAEGLDQLDLLFEQLWRVDHLQRLPLLVRVRARVEG